MHEAKQRLQHPDESCDGFLNQKESISKSSEASPLSSKEIM